MGILEEARMSRSVPSRGCGVLASRDRRGSTSPSPTITSALPRDRWPRHDRGHRRDCRRTRVARGEHCFRESVATGLGMVRSAHGMLPNPAPAVVELLEGIPTEGPDVAVELTTPTGAAMLAAWGSTFGPMPAMTIEATGFGAGFKSWTTCRTHPGRGRIPGGLCPLAAPGQGQLLVQIETNLDDVTGETLAHTVAALIDDGALDAWVVPVLMKKGRPGHVLNVLCDPVLLGDLRHRLAAETGSLGVRAHTVERWAAPREMVEVEVDGYPVRVKVSPGRVKVEHPNAARVAGQTGRPLREVAARAEAAWREQLVKPIATASRPWPGRNRSLRCDLDVHLVDLTHTLGETGESSPWQAARAYRHPELVGVARDDPKRGQGHFERPRLEGTDPQGRRTTRWTRGRTSIGREIGND